MLYTPIQASSDSAAAACSRRRFIGSIAAYGTAAAGLASPTAFARTASGATRTATFGDLPRRGEFVVRNACILTMDAALGEMPRASIHVRNGVIVAVQKDLPIPAGARVIEGDDAIVLPGLVDTHWHLWHTLFRSFVGERPEIGFYPTISRFGAVMTPRDIYNSTRLGTAEALNAGITTVHSWFHNVRSRAHAEADVFAIKDAGLRGRWSFGQQIDQSDKELIRLDDLAGMHRDWSRYSNDGLIDLGMAWRGMYRSEWAPPEVYRTELEKARSLGIPVTVHIATTGDRTGHIEAHQKAGLLGPDINIVHAVGTRPDELQMVKDSGASVSITPLTEMRAGYGNVKLLEYMNAGVKVGIGIDTAPQAGSADMSKAMSACVGVANMQSANMFKLSPRRALQLATIDGARVLGIDDKVGSLAPGKRADLIMVSTNGLNMGVFTDPANMIVECMQPQNIGLVVVDGRILKDQGRLTAIDPKGVIREARASLEEIRTRAAWK